MYVCGNGVVTAVMVQVIPAILSNSWSSWKIFLEDICLQIGVTWGKLVSWGELHPQGVTVGECGHVALFL